MAQPPRTHKIGWLLNRFGAVFAAAALALPVSPAAAQVVSAHGEWAALKFGERCEARSRAVLERRGVPPAIVGFAFDPRGRLQGQFYARLSRVPRGGSGAILTIGNQPFLLAVRGQWAWGRDWRQDSAIAAAARQAGSMRVESRDGAGRRIVDRYLLSGAATAIDAAAAACAQAGKAR
jgi:hypothetical protein